MLLAVSNSTSVPSMLELIDPTVTYVRIAGNSDCSAWTKRRIRPEPIDNVHVDFSLHQTVPAQGFPGIVTL